MNSREEQLKAFNRLLDTMDELREKCPWDKKQTNESLRPLTIEETYELAEAIMEDNPTEIKKELGDVLLHIVFYARIGSESEAFDIADVCNALVDKLISRHPHIYGDVKAEDEETVLKNWEQLKMKEGQKSVLAGVPSSLPSMVKAIRLQDKARGAGFDWPDENGPLEKIKEELSEFLEAYKHIKDDEDAVENEMGDLLFSIVNLSRMLGINPDNALERTNLKFKKRFEYLETQSKADGYELGKMSLEEMDKYWEAAKNLG